MKKYLEIELEDPENDFLRIVETLTRIGVPDEDSNLLTQICHILHKQGRYYVMHWKEMKQLDGDPVNVEEVDKLRRTHIAHLLVRWGLASRITNEEQFVHDYAPNIKIVSFAQRDDWQLVSRYKIGVDKRNGC